MRGPGRVIGRRGFGGLAWGAVASTLTVAAGRVWGQPAGRPGPVGPVGPIERDEIGDQVQRLPRERLPAFAADPETARLYRFAVDRHDVLRYMPCFCGCGRLGHRDNRGCYVKAEHADGTVTYTSHAAT